MNELKELSVAQIVERIIAINEELENSIGPGAIDLYHERSILTDILNHRTIHQPLEVINDTEN